MLKMSHTKAVLSIVSESTRSAALITRISAIAYGTISLTISILKMSMRPSCSGYYRGTDLTYLPKSISVEPSVLIEVRLTASLI